MERIFDLITNEERDAIDYMRRNYGPWEETPSEPFASCENFLYYWESAKSGILAEIFNGHLILEKEIDFTKDIDTVLEEFDDGLSLQDSEFMIAINNYLYTHNKEEDLFYRQNCIFGFDDYVKKFTDQEITLVEDNKTVKYCKGTRIMKIAHHIAAKLGLISEYEHFRNYVSRIINAGKQKGTLCLSIHPLDYITMSENLAGWTSCMNWTDGGEYRMGTVEMMNSPCVIVAYLRQSEEMNLCNNFMWNSKRWRTLIVVDPEVITTIKSYCYENSDLENAAVDWVKELIDNSSLDWHYDYEFKNEKCLSPNASNEALYRLFFRTEMMYNDFYRGQNVSGFARLKPEDREGNITIEYSGATECVWCGNEGEIDSESRLVCNNCERTTIYCATCESIIYDGEGIMTEDGVVCEDCIEDDYYWDVIDYVYKNIHCTSINEFGVVINDEVYIFRTSFYNVEQIKRNHHYKMYTSEYYNDIPIVFNSDIVARESCSFLRYIENETDYSIDTEDYDVEYIKEEEEE